MSSADTSRPFTSRTRRFIVGSWLISRMARIGFSRVMSRSTKVVSSSMRSRIDVAPTLRNVAYSLMFESPTITCSRRYRSASARGSSRVLMIGRLRVVADDTPSQMCSARWGKKNPPPPRRRHPLPRPGVDLPRDEERDEHLGVVVKVVPPRGHVVLVAAVRVARGVRVVLEQVDAAPDALVAQLLRRRNQELLEDPLTGLVMGQQVEDRVALRRGVLGVTAHVEVQPGAVCEEHVARPAPRHHPAEQVARHLVGAQPPLPPQGERDPVLVLEPEDPPLHHRNLPPPPPLGAGKVRCPDGCRYGLGRSQGSGDRGPGRGRDRAAPKPVNPPRLLPVRVLPTAGGCWINSS